MSDAPKIPIYYLIKRSLKTNLNSWTVVASLFVSLILIPIFIILVQNLQPVGEGWQHLKSTVFPRYISNTFFLVVGTAFLTSLIGVSTAWLVTSYKFPGSRIFAWALVLPLTIPTYIAAFTYSGLFDYGTPLQKLFQSLSSKPFDVMTIESLIFILSFVLFPYVYLITRASMTLLSSAFIEISQISGKSRVRTFFEVILPLSRPAIIAGLLLVIMEVLNDYGAVKYFGVDTLTTGIFRAWFSLGDLDAAVRISAVLLLFVLLLITIEKIERGRAKYRPDARSIRPMPKKVSLTGVKSLAAFTTCFIPFLFGFLLPFGQLSIWCSKTATDIVNKEFLNLIGNSFVLALLAAGLTLFVSVIITYATRLRSNLFMQSLSKLSILGYAIPGAVIAIGIMVPFAWIDTSIDNIAMQHFGISTGLIFSGTLIAVIFAYVVRFLALAMNPIESGFQNVCSKVDEASRSLGASPAKTLLRINAPVLKGVLLSAAILVFVDVLKELPLTLILRPFNFDTLATKTFELASDEMVAESANSALIIIAIGLLPIILVNKIMERSIYGNPQNKRFEEKIYPAK